MISYMIVFEGKISNAPRRNRTFNQRIKSPLLCLVELVAQWLIIKDFFKFGQYCDFKL